MGNFTALAITINNGNTVTIPQGQSVIVPVTIWNPPAGYSFNWLVGASLSSSPFSDNVVSESFANGQISDGTPMTQMVTITAPPNPSELGTFSGNIAGRPHNVPNGSDDWDTAGGAVNGTLFSTSVNGGFQ